MGIARTEDLGLFTPLMTTPSVHRAWWGVVILFLVHGLVVSSWLSRIPEVQTSLHLSNGILGLTLLSAAVGAVSIIPFVGMLIGRYGSRRVSIVSSYAFCLSVILPGIAGSAVMLALALLVYGALAAAMDVSMNAQGVEVEKQLGSPTMSRFHAMYSAGAMAGAAIGGWVATQGLTPPVHFTISGLINLIAIASIARLLNS